MQRQGTAVDGSPLRAVPITQEDRDVLRRELASIAANALDELSTAAERGHASWGMSTMYRLDAVVGLWLLDDLGWGLDEQREAFYVTAPTDLLVPWLRLLRDDNRQTLRDTAQALRDPQATWPYDSPAELVVTLAHERETCDHDLDVLRVCNHLLAELEGTSR